MLSATRRHDKNATAPNFLLSKDRLREAWTVRWITDPQLIAPGTAMPSGLFHRMDDMWIFSGAQPPELKTYKGDQAELVARYILQLTPEEAARARRTHSQVRAGSEIADWLEMAARSLDDSGMMRCGIIR